MANPDIQKEIDALKSDISRLRTDFADLSGALKDDLAGRARQAGEEVVSGKERMRKAVKNGIDDAKQRGRDTIDGIEQQVADRPVASIATAFGLGFVVAKLMGMAQDR